MTTAHETSDAFSDETLREQAVFQYAKEAEMKEMLGNLADGQIEFYKAVRVSTYSKPLLVLYRVTGHGRMGENYTCHSTHTSGRLIFRMLSILLLYRVISTNLLAV